MYMQATIDIGSERASGLHSQTELNWTERGANRWWNSTQLNSTLLEFSAVERPRVELPVASNQSWSSFGLGLSLFCWPVLFVAGSWVNNICRHSPTRFCVYYIYYSSVCIRFTYTEYKPFYILQYYEPGPIGRRIYYLLATN